MSRDPFAPLDPDFRNRVRNSFARQRAMDTLGIRLVRVEPGEVEMVLPFREDLTQQHGFIHAGILSTAMDSACGYAASSLMPSEAGVLTIEFKLNLLAPARGETFRLVGQVRKPGRTITVAEAEAFACDGDDTRLVATMTGTLMTVTGRDHIRH